MAERGQARPLPGQSGIFFGEIFDYLNIEPQQRDTIRRIMGPPPSRERNPDQRGAWSETMTRLVKPSGLLATLLFPFEDPISGRQGPPWPINAALVRSFLEDAFEELEVTEIESTHRGREGRERLALWRRR